MVVRAFSLNVCIVRLMRGIAFPDLSGVPSAHPKQLEHFCLKLPIRLVLGFGVFAVTSKRLRCLYSIAVYVRPRAVPTPFRTWRTYAPRLADAFGNCAKSENSRNRRWLNVPVSIGRMFRQSNV